MKQLPIVWQRLVVAGGTTCPRCHDTGQEVQHAFARLKEALALMGVEPSLECQEISEESFKAGPSESNRIWIAGKPMEEWLGGSAGTSPCCSVCGDSECRTLDVDGAIYETIPESLIVRAALIAASTLLAADSDSK